MSAPLVVNTKDGVCWTRRTATSSRIALYAPEGVCKCPEFVMATLPELAEHGIVGSADVLPMPVGPNPQPLSGERLAEIRDRERAATKGPWWTDTLAESDGSTSIGVDAGGDNWIVPCQDLDPADAEFIAHARADVPALLADNELLRAQVAALLAERHETNEALDDAVREPRARQTPCPCPPADLPGPHQVGCPQAEVPVPPAPERPVNELTTAFAPVAALREVPSGETDPGRRAAWRMLDREEPHDSPIHQEHRLGHDLPATGGEHRG